MTVSCCCPPEAGNAVCDLPAQNFQRPHRTVNACPECGKAGKPIQRQTLQSLLSVSLRQMQDVKYFFCRTQTCPVVYFSADSKQIFTLEQVRERVYQKEPEAHDVFVRYCFRHTVGELHAASPEDASHYPGISYLKHLSCWRPLGAESTFSTIPFSSIARLCYLATDAVE